MESLIKTFKRLARFISPGNILKSIRDPKKAVRFIKLYAGKDLGENREIREIISLFFPEKSGEAKRLLGELHKSAIYNKRFSSGRAGNVDAIILYLIARILKPEAVVETGVASGRSSSFILQALAHNDFGKLHSVELPQYYPADKKSDDPSLLINVEGNVEATGFIPEGKEPGWLIPADLRSRWSLNLGTSQEELPKLMKKLGNIGIFYHDSEHTYKNMLFEFQTVWPHIKNGGFLVSDDVHWNASFDDFSKGLNPEKVKIYKHGSIGIIKKI